MKKRNILHIIHSLNVGGAERLVFDFVRESNHDVFNMSVCCLDETGLLGEELKSQGFSVDTLGRRPGIDWGLIFRLRKLLREKEIDIIHAHQYPSFFYASMARVFSKRPHIIFTEHGRFYPEQRKIKRVIFDPFLSKLASEIIAISEATKDAMVKYDNFPRNRIKVIYNGVKFDSSSVDSFEKRRELNISPDDFILVTAARLDPIKNHQMLIRMMKRIVKVKPECKLIIAGDGPEYGNLSADIKKNGLEDSVRLLGYRNDVAEIFSVSDIFLLSSVSEGTSVTLLEAMHACLPAVVTNVGGNPEVLEDGLTGYLVESDNDQAMAEKVLMLCNNRPLLRELGEAARKRAEDLFSFEKMMRNYEDMYVKYGG